MSDYSNQWSFSYDNYNNNKIGKGLKINDSLTFIRFNHSFYQLYEKMRIKWLSIPKSTTNTQ